MLLWLPKTLGIKKGILNIFLPWFRKSPEPPLFTKHHTSRLAWGKKYKKITVRARSMDWVSGTEVSTVKKAGKVEAAQILVWNTGLGTVDGSEIRLTS